VECGGLKNLQQFYSEDILALMPGEVYRFRNASMQSSYVQMFIDLKQLRLPEEHFFQKRVLTPLLQRRLRLPHKFSPGDPGYDALRSQMLRLDPGKEGTDAYEAELLSVAVECCCALLSVATPAKIVDDPKEKAIACALEFMDRHLSEKITLQQLADVAGLHPNRLCAVFRELTERTPFDHLVRRRTREAGRLLRSTLLPIPEVASRCGFPSNSFFIRRFEKVYQIPPSQYRKKYFNLYMEE
jgi:AraC-like DNA-binding protein